MDQISFSADQFHAITAAPSVTMLPPGVGTSVWLMGILFTLKVHSNDTEGRYSLFEDRVPPGVGPPWHVHTLEDESWYLVEGELAWMVGEKQFHAKPGSFIHLPRFVPHTFKNPFQRTAVMVASYYPGGFEDWFLEAGKRVLVDDPSLAPPPDEEMSKAEIENTLERMQKGYGVILSGGHEPSSAST